MPRVLVPVFLAIAATWLGLTTVIALALADVLARARRGHQPDRRPVAHLVAALAARRLAARRSGGAPPFAVAVLAGDLARRGRVRRVLRTMLGQCAATIGPPTDPCAVVLVRLVERDGRPLRGCVERWTFPDRTRRTVISLPVEERGQALSLDDLAARLAAYYWAVAGVERAVVIADALPPGAAPASRPVARHPTPPLAALGGLPTGALGGAPYQSGPRP